MDPRTIQIDEFAREQNMGEIYTLLFPLALKTTQEFLERLGVTLSDTDTNQLCHDSLVDALTASLRSWDPEKARFSTYCMTSLRRTYLNRWAQRYLYPSASGKTTAWALSSEVSEDDLLCAATVVDYGNGIDKETLHREIEKLPVRIQEVMYDIYFNNRTQKQIARRLKICQATVRQRRDRGLLLLSKALRS